MPRDLKSRRVSRGVRIGVVIAFCLCVSCAQHDDEDESPCGALTSDLSLRYRDVSVHVDRVDDYPQLYSGDTLYCDSPGSDGRGRVTLWLVSSQGPLPSPYPDGTRAEHRGFLVGDATLYCSTDAVGVDTVSFLCASPFGSHAIFTLHADTLRVYGYCFRVCCENGVCSAWSDPISFTVVDTIPR